MLVRGDCYMADDRPTAAEVAGWLEDVISSGGSIDHDRLVEALQGDDTDLEFGGGLRYLIHLVRRASGSDDSPPRAATVADAPSSRPDSAAVDEAARLNVEAATLREQLKNRTESLKNAKAHIALLEKQVANRDRIIEALKSSKPVSQPKGAPPAPQAERSKEVASVQEAPVSEAVSGGSWRFDGSNRILTRALGTGPLRDFSIAVDAKHHPDSCKELRNVMNATWPMMPFSNSGLAAYLINNETYRIKMGGNLVDIPAVNGSISFIIKHRIDPDGGESIFELKCGQESVSRRSSQIKVSRTFVIGGGYLSRGWWGNVNLLRVIEHSVDEQGKASDLTALEFIDGRLVVGRG